LWLRYSRPELVTLRKRRPVGRIIYPASSQAILDELAALPISSWRYNWDHPDVRHLGPMSQDFADAFGLGEDERMIFLLDANGVNMASLQALYRRLQALEQKVEALEGARGTDAARKPSVDPAKG
jgi:hypothetical protein